MNKKYLIVGAVVVVVVVAVLVARGGKRGGNTVPQTQEEIAAKAIAATIDLLGAEHGIATIAEIGGKMQVQYGVVDAPEGVVQPAHIQAGTCANPGDLKHLLDFPVDGISTTDLGITLAELKAELPLIINVRKSLEELTTSVACGAIVLP